MLNLPIKKRWFDMSLRGEKGDEYREDKPYWRKRFASIGLCDENGVPTGRTAEVIFRNGYGKNAPFFRAVVRMSFGPGRLEWGAIPKKNYFRLHYEEIFTSETKKKNTQFEYGKTLKLSTAILSRINLSISKAPG